VCVSAVNDGNSILGIALDTDGTLAISVKIAASFTKKNGSTVLSANTWYRLCLSYVITSTTNWTAKLYINGVLEVTMTNADATLSVTGTSCVDFGGISFAYQGSTSSLLTVWVDDIYIDNRTDLTDPGDIHVTNKRPNANGTVNNFVTQIGAGGSGYGSGHSPQVNEQPLSTTNGWSVVAVAATTEEYNIEAASVGDVDISSATLIDYMGWVYTKALIAETGSIRVNNTDSNISILTTNALFTKAAGSTTYPAGAGHDIGEVTSATATTVSLYEAGILFAYLAGGAAAKLPQSRPFPYKPGSPRGLR
jgi:hypothetical protein